ncbi:MAG: FCD domain-containing protein [Pigmentiphaga sp.]|nr:FCD domain-containing protein [Pigmentiphaga sp.]
MASPLLFFVIMAFSYPFAVSDVSGAGSTLDGARAERGLPLSEQAYRNLRRDILNGTLEPDIPLRFEGLKERYGLSFSPLREALARLQAERLVTATALRGYRVAEVSLTEMWDAIQTRVLLETAALRDSLARGDEAWEERVDISFHALERQSARLAVEAGRSEEPAIEMLEERHRQFHEALISGASSRWLRELSATLYGQTERYRRPILARRWQESGDRGGVQDEHRALRDAALSRQADLACELLGAHLRRTGEFIERSGLLA